MYDFNISPYYDDYDETKDYYKILFRPGVALQAREFTQLQTIFGKQVSRLGSHIFEEGSMVIPGELTYDLKYTYVLIDPTSTDGSATDFSDDTFWDTDATTIIGNTVTGLTSNVSGTIVNHYYDSVLGKVALYVKYNASGTAAETVFTAGETLSVSDSVIQMLVDSTPTYSGIGSAANVKEGIYFIYGMLLRVAPQTIILSPYSATPSCRIGLLVVETIITPDEDATLNNIAQGTPNYGGPGAHRYKVELELTSLALGTETSITSKDFFEQIRLVAGSLQKNDSVFSQYSELEKTLARRTYDTNGDFIVKPFFLKVADCYETAWDALIISGGSSDLVDDPFTTTFPLTPGVITVTQAGHGMNTDDEIEIYGVSAAVNGIADYNINGFHTITRVDANSYTFVASNSDVATSAGNGGGVGVKVKRKNDTKLTLQIDSGVAYVRGFEIRKVGKTYIDIDKAQESVQESAASVNIELGNYIYIKKVYGVPDLTNYAQVELRDQPCATPGTKDGNIIGYARCRLMRYYSGTPGDPASSDAVYKLYLFDITMSSGKNFYNTKQIAYSTTFTADVVLSQSPMTGQITYTSGEDHIHGTGVVWFTDPSQRLYTGDFVQAKDDSGVWQTFVLTGNADGDVTISVTAVTATITGKAFYYCFAELREPAKNIAIFNMPQRVIKSVTDANGDCKTLYYVSRVFTGTSDGDVAITLSAADEEFVSFTDDDYMLVYTSGAKVGQYEPLVAGDVVVSGAGNTTCTISNLTAGNVKIICTVKKSTATASVQKTKGSPQSGSYAYNGGDANVVTLDKADVLTLDHVYESVALKTPAADTDPDIVDRYDLDTGQRDNFYDRGRIIRKPGTQAPAGALLIKFTYYAHGTANNNYFSVDSYDASDYDVIPVYDSTELGYRYALRDCLDFRPRMNDAGTGFSSTGSSITEIPIRAEVTADYSYYLNRIDKIILDPAGNFIVRQGVSALLPQEPENFVDGMFTHRLNLRAYTAGSEDVLVDMIPHRRYTMDDISNLDQRIGNLEANVALSLLEKDTADMTIKDDNGLDRYKNGFCVDPFTGTGGGDVLSDEWWCSVDITQKQLRPSNLQGYVSFIEADTTHRVANGYQLTGDLITLPYSTSNDGAYSDLVKQPLGSSAININPHNVIAFVGTLTLDPPFDEWKDTVRTPDLIVNNDEYDAVIRKAGPLGTIWNDWETTQFGQWKTSQGVVVNSYNERADQVLMHRNATGEIDPKDIANRLGVKPRLLADGTFEWPFRHVDVVRYTHSRDLQQTRQGVQASVTAKTVNQDYGDKVIDVSYIPFIRSREVRFVAKGMKPSTRVFPFFDNISVALYCKPQTNYPTSPATYGSNNDSLTTDVTGALAGIFTIPNSDTVNFRTGERVFRLTSSATNSSQDLATWAAAVYRAQGLQETKQRTIVSTRTAEISWHTISQERTVTDESISEDLEFGPWVDPLSQSFMVTASGGAFVPWVKLYFRTKPGAADLQIPVKLEIREMVNGYPGQKIVPFSEKLLDADEVTTNYVQDNGDLLITGPGANGGLGGTETIPNYTINDFVATEFTFESPVYLKQGSEYCVTILSDCQSYQLWKATMGENLIGTEIPIQQQPYAGYLFTSKNASTWSADPTSVLMFIIGQCTFTIAGSGVATFFNDAIPAKTLDVDPIHTTDGSKKVRIYHPNHGMFNTTSQVTIAGVTGSGSPAKINNVLVSEINGTHTSISDIDFDSYCITVSTDAANATGDGGGSAVTATENRPYDVIYPVVGNMVLPDTDIKYYLRTTTGRAIHGSQTPYVKQLLADEIPIIANQNFSCDTPKCVASTINETNSVNDTTATDSVNAITAQKSLVLKAVLTSDNANLSPVLDTAKLSAITISNLLDNATESNTNADEVDDVVLLVDEANLTFNVTSNTITTNADSTTYTALLPCSLGKYLETSGTSSANDGTYEILSIVKASPNMTITVDGTLANGDLTTGTLTLKNKFVAETSSKGSSKAKYPSTRMVLAQPATGLKIMFAAYRHSTAYIDLYYKISKIDDPTIFDDIPWVLATALVDNTPAGAENSFKDYEYVIDDLDDFTVCAAKIVMRGTDSTKPPRIKDFRMIALAT